MSRQQAGGSSDTSESSKPVRKRARKKAPRMDEDTMVALALSRSLLEQEKERERHGEEERRIQAQLVIAPVVQGRAASGESPLPYRVCVSKCSASLAQIKYLDLLRSKI